MRREANGTDIAGSHRRSCSAEIWKPALTVLLYLSCFAATSIADSIRSDVPEFVSTEISLAGSERPSISRFLQVRRACSLSDMYFGPSFSLAPDGRLISFVTDISGKPQLWVADADGEWPRQLTFGESVTFHRWVPNGQYILYGSDRSGNEQEGYYLITPDGKRERELLPASNAFRLFGTFTEDSQKAIYASTGRTMNDYDIHIIDLTTGEDLELFRGRMGLEAESISPDETKLLLSEQDGEDANKLFLNDIVGKQLKELLVSRRRSRYDNFNWTPDGKGFYLTTDHGRDRIGLAFYNVEKESLRFVETPENDVVHAKLSLDGRYLAWTENMSSHSMLRLRDLEGEKDVAIPELPQGIICSLNWAGKVPVLGIALTSPKIPGDIWTWDLRSGQVLRRTWSTTAGIDMSKMVVPEVTAFAGRDGTVIHGLLYRPHATKSGSKPPVVINVHGGPTGQARPSFDPTIQYLLTHGIAVFDLNYRGSTGYGKAFSRLNDQRLREHELLDIQDALDHLTGCGVDPSRAGIMGASYGGYLVMAALTRIPGRFRCGVARVPVSDWLTALEESPPFLMASDRIEYGDITDAQDRAFFKQISPLSHVEQIDAPILVLHGANDVRCPVDQSDRFVEAVRRHGGEVEYLRFADEGHRFKKVENELLAYSRVVSFIESNLEVSK